MSTDFEVEQPLTPAGERLVAAAAQLFYRQGIRAVGVDLIADTAGTTKKTLYDRFGSKDALVALYLRRRALRWQEFVGGYLERTPHGRDRVLVVFDALADWLEEQDRGCAFVNAHAEIGGTDHPGVPVIRAEKAAMRALFTEQVRAAGLAGAERLGAQLHVLYEGANVAVTAGGQADAIDHARAAAARLLEG
ncbi:TetR/AcrR family transcriptional regulator [Pseudonocardia sichuanensis]|uniref:TetR family transcriptional regulator n=1 Tax=Pseudonocardia kunmingensis TaxID=630975 RepID=A0A543DYD5_9PSEU|nr:TetR/AcrR family transcriptional regulator [Pseudonocardia kunmingensis]TQM14338.1 TetR family transcriptional regulator [Pseudonocardia kunmingensis]